MAVIALSVRPVVERASYVGGYELWVADGAALSNVPIRFSTAPRLGAEVPLYYSSTNGNARYDKTTMVHLRGSDFCQNIQRP